MNTKQNTIFGYCLAVLIILMGIPKIVEMQMAVDNFERWHLGDSMRLIVGGIEIILGLLMFYKPLKNLAAFAVFCMMPAGAITHIAAQEWPMLALPIVVGLLFLWYLSNAGVINLSNEK